MHFLNMLKKALNQMDEMTNELLSLEKLEKKVEGVDMMSLQGFLL